MPQSSKIKIEISPQVMKWARLSIRLNEVAVLEYFSRKSKIGLGVDSVVLNKLENEKISIRPSVLKEFSILYKRPLSVFFLKDPPKEKKPPTDYRTLGNSKIGMSISSETALVFRSAWKVQTAAKELAEELRQPIIFKPENYDLSADSVKLGLEFRNRIGLSIEKQKGFRTPDVFFNWLRAELEATGLFVLKEPFPIKDALAFSFTDEQPFIIVVNSKWGGLSYSPKLFSLLHEYAHVLLRHGGICNNFIDSTESIEKFCNKFASNALIPIDLFEVEFKKITSSFNQNQIDDYLLELYSIFKASRPVLLLKFRELKYISQDFYEEKILEWKKKFDLSENASKEELPFSVYPHTKAINSRGKTFSDLVLKSVIAEKITRDKASYFLGIQPDYLSRVAKKLGYKI